MPSGDLFGENAAASGAAIVAHCDGGARGNPGPAGYGAVITTDDGTVLAELSEFLGFRTNNFAEYSGLLGVLQWAIEHGYRNVRVVSDSELMVKQIQGRYKVNSPDLRPLYEEAKRRIAKLGSFTISHALRHKNKTADRLANEAMDRGTNRKTAPNAASGAAPAPPRATPYPSPSDRPPAPREMDPRTERTAASGSEMMRGFVRDGAIHLLGGKTLPDGVFVKIIRE